MRVGWIALLVCAASAAQAADPWSGGDVSPGHWVAYEWTDTTDTSKPLDASACGSVAIGYQDDVLGSDTTASANLVRCENRDSAIGTCSTALALTSDVTYQTLRVRPGYFHVDVQTAPAANAKARVTLYCSEEVSGGGSSSEIVVAPSGGDTSVICGGSTCVAGSAVELARAKSPSVTNPVAIRVLPGFYDELVSIDNITDLTLDLGPGVTVRRPTTTIAGGLVRIATNSSDHGVDRVTLHVASGALVQNDSYSSPEAAVQIGPESCTTPEWGDVYIVDDGRIVGHHDGIQWCGDGTDNASAVLDLPRLTVTGAGQVISGRDALTKKGNSIDHVSVAQIISWPNYCEDTSLSTFLAAQTGAVVSSADSSHFVMQTDDGVAPDDFYVNRLVTFSAIAGACGAANVCNGAKGVIDSFDTATNEATFRDSTCAVNTGCNYSIAAVPNWQDSPCKDIDWTQIAGAQASPIFGSWKATGVHFGIVAPGTAPSPADFFSMNGTSIKLNINESMVMPTSVIAQCGSQANIAGILAYGVRHWQHAEFLNTDVEVNVNADQPDITCSTPIAGVSDQGTTAFADGFYFSGKVRVNNAGDPDENVYGITTQPTTAGGIQLGPTTIEVNNTVAGYTGATAAMKAVSPGTIEVEGDVSGPDLLLVSTPDRFTGWKETCIQIPDGSGTAFNDAEVGVFPLNNSFSGIQVQQVGCSCQGTCGTPPTADFTDTAGSNTIANEVTCATPGNAITWTDVSTDAQSTITSGERVIVNEGATQSGTGEDEMLACIRYTTNHFNPGG